MTYQSSPQHTHTKRSLRKRSTFSFSLRFLFRTRVLYTFCQHWPTSVRAIDQFGGFSRDLCVQDWVFVRCLQKVTPGGSVRRAPVVLWIQFTLGTLSATFEITCWSPSRQRRVKFAISRFMRRVGDVRLARRFAAVNVVLNLPIDWSPL